MGHTESLRGIDGESGTRRATAKLILKVAPHDFTVLIPGELATGNELIAHSIQRNSNRVKVPFLAINCGSTPETVMEAHLFGHQKRGQSRSTRSTWGGYQTRALNSGRWIGRASRPASASNAWEPSGQDMEVTEADLAEGAAVDSAAAARARDAIPDWLFQISIFDN